MSQLVLSGEVIPGKEIKISLSVDITGEDLSGQGSDTADSDTGIKPKILSVRLLIPHKSPEQLTQIIQLAEQLDNVGKRTIYTIQEITADAVKMRQVKFDGPFKANVDESLNAWRVSFSLKEHRSVAEKKEDIQANETPLVAQQNGTGDNIATAPVDDNDSTPPLTGTEKMFKNIDNYIGGNNETA